MFLFGKLFHICSHFFFNVRLEIWFLSNVATYWLNILIIVNILFYAIKNMVYSCSRVRQAVSSVHPKILTLYLWNRAVFENTLPHYSFYYFYFNWTETLYPMELAFISNSSYFFPHNPSYCMRPHPKSVVAQSS